MELYTVRQRVKPTDEEIAAIQTIDAMLSDIRKKTADEELYEAAQNISEGLSDFILRFLLIE